MTVRSPATPQRGLERLRVRAARERERLPSHLTEILLAPDRFQFRGVAGRQQALESCGEPTEPANRIHARNVESAWILRYPIRSLNLASLMRRCRALLTATLLLTACSGASSGPIVLGLAGPFAQPRGVSMRRAASTRRDDLAVGIEPRFVRHQSICVPGLPQRRESRRAARALRPSHAERAARRRDVPRRRLRAGSATQLRG